LAVDQKVKIKEIKSSIGREAGLSSFRKLEEMQANALD